MAELRWLSLLCMVPACAFVATTRPTRGGGGVAASPTRPATTSLRSVDAAAAIFELLADDVVLLDPADGQCCRNQCASCSYYELEDGAPVYRHEELTGGRWLPARPVTEVPPRLQVADRVWKLIAAVCLGGPGRVDAAAATRIVRGGRRGSLELSTWQPRRRDGAVSSSRGDEAQSRTIHVAAAAARRRLELSAS